MSETHAAQKPGDWVTEAGYEAEPTIGARLRAAREARELDVEDVAQTLKLGVRQVEALESGNWWGLPGNTFIRGFVRNYARLLQLDPAPLMAQLDATLEKPPVNLDVPDIGRARMPSARGTGRRRDRSVVVLGLVLVILAGVVYALLPNDLSALRDKVQGLIDSVQHGESKAPETAAAREAPAPEPVFPPGQTPQQVLNPQVQAPVQMAPAALAPAGEAQMRFVFAGESWIEVRDRDNKVVLSQRNAPGTEQRVDGRGPFSVVVGQAAAVKLYWHGKPVDLAPHTKGEVARLVLE